MSLFSWVTKKAEADSVLVDENVCPNCWGRQEYGQQFLEAVRDRQIDVTNGNSDAARSFIQRFVVEHISGIRLVKDGEKKVCPHCEMSWSENSPGDSP